MRLFVGGVGSGKTRAGCVEILRQPPGSTGMVLAPTYPMLRDATLRTFLDLARAADVLGSFNKGEMVARLHGNRTVLFRSADNPDRLRGPNLGWFYLDEAAMMGQDAWLIMLGRLREQPARAWATTTPRGKNWLYKEFTKPDGPHRDVIKASSTTNHFLPPEFVRTLLATYDDHFAAQEVGGEFLDDTHGELIPGHWVDRLPSVVRAAGHPGTRRMAVDLGYGTGADRGVILIRDDLGILHLHQSSRMGVPETAAMMADLGRRWGVRQEDMTYDANGPGRDLPRYLEQVGLTEPAPYHGSGAGGPKHENRRSLCAWRLRQRLDPERPRPVPAPPEQSGSFWAPIVPALPPEVQPPFALPDDREWWPSLLEELKALKYAMKGKKIALERKEDMAKRLGRSPDLVDALLMAFSGVDEC